MGIEWAVYQRPGARFTAEPYTGIKHIAAISMSEKVAREFATSQNRAAIMLRRLNRLRAKERARELELAREQDRQMGFNGGRESRDGR